MLTIDEKIIFINSQIREYAIESKNIIEYLDGKDASDSEIILLTKKYLDIKLAIKALEDEKQSLTAAQ